MKKLFVLVCLLAIGFCNVAWAAKRQAKHVVLIALDGWGAYPRTETICIFIQLNHSRTICKVIIYCVATRIASVCQQDSYKMDVSGS